MSVEPNDRFRFLSINQSFLNATGLTEDQVVGKDVREVIPEPSLTIALHNYEQAIRENKTMRWEEVTNYPTGTKYGDVAVTPVSNARGQCTNLVGSVHDITKRKNTEKALKESEAKYRALVEQSLQGIMVAQVSPPHMVFANPAMANILGYTADELTSLSPEAIQGLIHPEDRALFFSRFSDLVQVDHPSSPYEFRAIRKDGEVRWMQTTSKRIEYEGKPALQATTIDITKRKEYETKLLTLHRHAAQLDPAGSIELMVKDTLDAMEFSLGFDHMHIAMVEGNDLQVSGSRGRRAFIETQPLDGHGLAVKAALTKSTLRIADTRKEPEYVDPKGFDWRGAHTVLSELIVPVVISDETVAVLCVDSVHPDIFTAEDQTLIETLANHVASCLARLKHQEALRVSEARFRRYFELGLVGMAIETPTGGWIDANNQLCEIFGYSREELFKMHFTEFTHPDDVAKDLELFNALIRGDIEHYSLEKRFIRKNGAVIHGIIAINCTAMKPAKPPRYLVLSSTSLNAKRRRRRCMKAKKSIGASLKTPMK